MRHEAPCAKRGATVIQEVRSVGMASIENLCVYCGSRTGDGDGFVRLARALGLAMAQRGVGLVYGGGRIGLMGVVADAVHGAGGRVTGIIPEHLHAREVGNEGCGELVVVDSMHTRKRMMFERADAFVALPGGFGTVDELVEMLTWRQLGMHDKPICVLDQDGYWQPLLGLFDHIVERGFAGSRALDHLYVVNGIDDLFATLGAAPEPRLPERTDRL